jgi:hypothetical protein
MDIPASTPFERLSDRELACLYRALSMYLVSPESGVWFHQADKGDPAYRLSGEGRGGQGDAGVARAEWNTLYTIGHRVHREIERRDRDLFRYQFPAAFIPVFESWEAFCRAISGPANPEHRSDSGPASSSTQGLFSPLRD